MDANISSVVGGIVGIIFIVMLFWAAILITLIVLIISIVILIAIFRSFPYSPILCTVLLGLYIWGAIWGCNYIHNYVKENIFIDDIPISFLIYDPNHIDTEIKKVPTKEKVFIPDLIYNPYQNQQNYINKMNEDIRKKWEEMSIEERESIRRLYKEKRDKESEEKEYFEARSDKERRYIERFYKAKRKYFKRLSEAKSDKEREYLKKRYGKRYE